MVENIVAIELSYINTRHPDFQRATDTVASLYTNDRPQERKPSASQNSSKPAKNRPVQFANQPSPLANGDDACVTKVRGHPCSTSAKGLGGWVHSVLEQIQIKGYLDQSLSQYKSLNPVGLKSARIEIPHGGSH